MDKKSGLSIDNFAWIRLLDNINYLQQLSEKAMAPHSSTLAWKIPRVEKPVRLQSMGSRRVGHNWATSLSRIGEGNGNPLQCSFAWRIPGTGEPGGLPSMGSHRVGHDWSDLAVAVANTDYGIHNIYLACDALLPPSNKPSMIWFMYSSSGESSLSPPILGRDRYVPVAALGTPLAKKWSPCIKTRILGDE